MKNTDMKVEQRLVADLVPYARNSRTHDETQISQLAASIKEFGWMNPIIIDADGGLIAGHGRLMAAQKLKIEKVPCIVADHLTEAQRKAYVIADNRLAMSAGWDTELLKIEIQELSDMDFNLDLLGFEQMEIDELFGEPETEEVPPESIGGEVPEAPITPVTQPGDIWQLGKNRILCGDCRVHGDVEKLLDGAIINVAVTSPPYASQREYDPASGFKPIHPDEFTEWYADVAANIMAHLADDGSYFMNIKPHCHEGERHLYVYDLVIAHKRQWGWRFVDDFVWDRVHPGFPGAFPNRFKNGWEPVFHFTKNADIKFRPDNVLIESKGESSDREGKNANGSGFGKFKWDSDKARPNNIVRVSIGETEGAEDHPATYPVGLPIFFIKAFSDTGDIVFDPFMGSGTTLIAADSQGRIAYGTELSPRYTDVIVQRWQTYSGEKATLVGDGRTFDELKEARLNQGE